MTQPRAILLDFYGTVVEEDEAPVTLVCKEIFKAPSNAKNLDELTSYWWRTFFDLYPESYGDTFRYEKELGYEALQKTMSQFNVNLDSEKLKQALSEYWDKYWGKPAIFPESREVLEKLTKLKIPICLVSNIDNDVLNSALSYNQLSFDFIVTSEDCKSYKPRPEMFDKALSLLNLSNNEVLHVGDSLNSDVRGANNMNIPVLWINRKKRDISSRSEKPDYISTTLTGIFDIIGQPD